MLCKGTQVQNSPHKRASMKTMGTHACLYPGLPAAPACLRLTRTQQKPGFNLAPLQSKEWHLPGTYPGKVLGGRAFLGCCGTISFLFPLCSQMLLIYCRLSSALSYSPVVSSSDALVSQWGGKGHGPSSFPLHHIPLALCSPGLSRSLTEEHQSDSFPWEIQTIVQHQVNEGNYSKLFLHLKCSVEYG